MFENIMTFFKKLIKKEKEKSKESSNTAKERLHLVLMQDRANVSADFLELMRQEIIEVIKKYIDVDETAIDVHLTNKTNEDGTVGAPALYANIPIITIKNEARKLNVPNKEEQKEKNENKESAKNEEESKQEEQQKEESIEQKEIENKVEENKQDEQPENTLPKDEQEKNNKENEKDIEIIEENIKVLEENIAKEDKKEETTSNN